MQSVLNTALDDTLKYIMHALKDEVYKLASSGLIDIESYENVEFELSDILISAAMLRIGNRWKEKHKREVNNLLKF